MSFTLLHRAVVRSSARSVACRRFAPAAASSSFQTRSITDSLGPEPEKDNLVAVRVRHRVIGEWWNRIESNRIVRGQGRISEWCTSNLTIPWLSLAHHPNGTVGADTLGNHL